MKSRDPNVKEPSPSIKLDHDEAGLTVVSNSQSKSLNSILTTCFPLLPSSSSPTPAVGPSLPRGGEEADKLARSVKVL